MMSIPNLSLPWRGAFCEVWAPLTSRKWPRKRVDASKVPGEAEGLWCSGPKGTEGGDKEAGPSPWEELPGWTLCQLTEAATVLLTSQLQATARASVEPSTPQLKAQPGRGRHTCHGTSRGPFSPCAVSPASCLRVGFCLQETPLPGRLPQKPQPVTQIHCRAQRSGAPLRASSIGFEHCLPTRAFRPGLRALPL